MTAAGVIFFVVCVFLFVMFQLIRILDETQRKYAALRAIGVTLYGAGHWKAETVSAHAADILWRRFRDALELPVGTATNLGLVPDEQEEYRLP